MENCNSSSGHQLKALGIHLLIVDCETRRFTIEGPLGRHKIYYWRQEVEGALTAGRSIFSIPIGKSDISLAKIVGQKLEFAYWPSKTIIMLPEGGWRNQIPHEPSNNRISEIHSAILNELHQARSLWLRGMVRSADGASIECARRN
jgi:hypothetical protein